MFGFLELRLGFLDRAPRIVLRVVLIVSTEIGDLSSHFVGWDALGKRPLGIRPIVLRLRQWLTRGGSLATAGGPHRALVQVGVIGSQPEIVRSVSSFGLYVRNHSELRFVLAIQKPWQTENTR